MLKEAVVQVATPPACAFTVPLTHPPAHILSHPQLRAKYGDDWERIGRMSIIEDQGAEKCVRQRFFQQHLSSAVVYLRAHLQRST